MGSLGDGNGDGWPSDGGGPPEGLPDLPPEWGVIVIPDNVAELDSEAAQVRRELRRDARRARWRRRLGLKPAKRGRAGEEETSALAVPLLIMVVAIVATLTSLFAISWPGNPPSNRARPSTRPATSAASPQPAPDLALVDTEGRKLRLRDSLPAVLLFIDGCECADLVRATDSLAGPRTTVIAVGRSAPALPTGLSHARAAADQDGALGLALFGSPSPDRGVVVINDKGDVTRKLVSAANTDSFRDDVTALG